MACRWLERVAEFSDNSSDRIPVGFILGFYVSLVVSRFWGQLNALPWPQPVAVFVSSMIHGRDERGRILRRSIIRYLTVAYILTMRSICPPIRRRFPTFKDIHEAGNSQVFDLLNPFNASCSKLLRFERFSAILV